MAAGDVPVRVLHEVSRASGLFLSIMGSASFSVENEDSVEDSQQLPKLKPSAGTSPGDVVGVVITSNYLGPRVAVLFRFVHFAACCSTVAMAAAAVNQKDKRQTPFGRNLIQKPLVLVSVLNADLKWVTGLQEQKFLDQVPALGNLQNVLSSSSLWNRLQAGEPMVVALSPARIPPRRVKWRERHAENRPAL